MLWEGEAPARLAPEERHVVLFNKFNEEERILPEAFCKEKFGEKRWNDITSGMDKGFDAYPYVGADNDS